MDKTLGKILVIRMSSLGDIVLTFPVLQRLKTTDPSCQIHFLVKEKFAKAVESCPYIDRVVSFSSKQSLFSLITQIRKESYDHLLDLHGTLRSYVIRLMSGVQSSVSYQKAVLWRRLFVYARLGKTELNKHTVDRYQAALQALLGNTWIGEDPKKILLFQTAFLGDAVLTLPLLDGIKKRFPTSEIHLICTPQIQELFSNHPAISSLYSFDKRSAGGSLKKFFDLLNWTKNHQFDLAFIPHRSFRSAFMVWLARVPIRIGFHNSQSRCFLTHIVPFDWKMHDAERNLSLLSIVGEKQSPAKLSLTIQPKIREDIQKRLSDEGVTKNDFILGVNPGSTWATKQWLADRFAKVADWAIREKGWKVVFVGGPGDVQTMEQVLSCMSEKPINWVGKTNLSELLATVASCQVFLTNDSGPMHVAVASDVPTVALFGPTTRELGFFPYGNGHIVLEKDFDCRPCGLHGAKKCPLGHFNCMKGISTEEVIHAIEKQYTSRSSQSVSPV